MRFGSVCSGIEAASVAWHPLGWKAAWLAEIEPFPSAVLAHHYPDVPNLGDMTALPERIRAGEVESPDVFCGGTPCQAFSVAGLRKSLDDARGNLSLTFCEIADAIDHVRAGSREQPAIIFWENVPGVLSTKDNAFGCFLSQLCGGDEPLIAPDGWPTAGCVSGPKRTAAWRVLDAQYFGVAQRRRRVFVVASARNDFDPAAVLFEFDGLRRDTAPSREAREVAPTIPARSLGGGGLGTDFDCDGGVISIHPHCIGRRPESGPQGKEYLLDGSAYCMDSRGQPQAVAQPIPFDTTQITSAANYSAPKAGDACHPLAAGAHAPAIAQPIAFQTSGYGASVDPDTASTMQASYDRLSNQVYGCVTPAMAVRRLTPEECEKLQGFLPGYTNIPWRNKPESPDGPRYKALGNSWAVPNVRWIGQRIAEALK
jgi:DNA (cytosine-5)-methyltransferase 1